MVAKVQKLAKVDIKAALRSWEILLEDAREHRKDLVNLDIQAVVKSYDEYIKLLEEKIAVLRKQINRRAKKKASASSSSKKAKKAVMKKGKK